jgi:hypothetical protein
MEVWTQMHRNDAAGRREKRVKEKERESAQVAGM